MGLTAAEAQTRMGAILERMRTAPAYHPLSANTFADWSMEAGDVVTVSRGGIGCTSPVCSTSMKWRGKQEIEITSEGSKNREPISKVSAQKYGGGPTGNGGASMRATQGLFSRVESEDGNLYSVIEQTYSYLRSEVGNIYERMYTRIEQTYSYVRSVADYADGLAYSVIEQTYSYIRSEVVNKVDSLYSRIEQTDSYIRNTVYNEITGAKSRIEQTVERIGLSVGTQKITSSNKISAASTAGFPATGAAGKFYYAQDTQKYYIWRAGQYQEVLVQDINNEQHYVYLSAADIVTAINEDGTTDGVINADRVILGQGTLTQTDLDTWAGNAYSGTGVFAKFLTVDTLTAQTIKSRIAEIDQLDANSLSVTGLIVGDREDPIAEINPDGIANFAMVQVGENLDALQLVDAEVVGNTLKIWKVGDPENAPSINFSKAVTAMINAGSWNGGVLQINATPGTANYKVGFGSSVTADMKLVLVGDGLHPVSHESNEKFLYLPVKVQQKDDSTTPPTFSDVYGWENLIIDCTEVWNAGKLSVAPVTPQLSGSWNTGTHILTVTSNPQAAANYTVGFGGSVSANEKLVLSGDGMNPVAHGTNAKYLYLPVNVQKKDDSTNPPTFTDVYGPENLIVDCSDVWDAGEAAGEITGTAAGKSAVDLGQFSWNQYSGQVLPEHRELSISTSGKGTGNDITRTKDLYLTEGTHATGKIRVMLQDDTGTGRINVARLEVDAYLPADYQAALATVPTGYVTNVTISPSQDVELAPSGGITAEQTVTVTATDGSGNSTTIGSVKISASGYNATEYEQHAKDTAESAALKFIDWGSVSDDDHPITDLYPGSTVAVQYGPEGSEIELAGQRFYVPESSSDPITWADTLSGTSEKRFAYITHGDETKSYRIAYNTGWKNAGGKTRTAVEVRARAAASRSDASIGDSDPVVARLDIQSYLNNARNAGGQSASIQDLGLAKATDNILTPGHTYGIKYMNEAGVMVWCDSWGYVEDSYQNGWDDAIEWANKNLNLESHTGPLQMYVNVQQNTSGQYRLVLTTDYSYQQPPKHFRDKNGSTVYIYY